jgi:hypothetical protein
VDALLSITWSHDLTGLCVLQLAQVGRFLFHLNGIRRQKRLTETPQLGSVLQSLLLKHSLCCHGSLERDCPTANRKASLHSSYSFSPLSVKNFQLM